MRAQVHAFASAITWAPDGSLARLLTDTQAPVPELLLPAFRGAASGSGPVRTLEPTAYAGIWSLPAPNAIAASARFESPVRRGAAIQARLLCMALPLAPPGVAAVEPTSLDETTTMREMLAQHSVASTCAGCHKFMDPVGFAFSQFDAAGGFRVDDVDGQPVDDSGTLEWGSGEAAVPFIGAPELMKIVAPVERTQRCFAAHWLGFALGRAVKDVPEMDFVDPAASYVRKRAQISGQLNLRGLLRAVVETKPFLAP
jgi:hypothetical protein